MNKISVFVWPGMFFILFLGLSFKLSAQLYFPPTSGSSWDTKDPVELGWCQERIDSLYKLLETNNSKAFILLKDGKIVLEEYFDGHTNSDTWYWASAGKSLTASLVGIAQQEGHLSIMDSSSKHLGNGWTSCTPQQEGMIRVRDQLSMTTGLNDGVSNPDCTDDTCLHYLADAGTRWAYHNGPYTMLDEVISNSTGSGLNVYLQQKIKNVIGMDGLYLPLGDNNVYWSTARGMARFGLLILAEGEWDGTAVLSDTTYFNEMVNSSQNLNEAYGYLWWLNGKSSYMVPQLQTVLPGSMNPNAPDDMFAALGKNGQFINIVPSQNLVWIRMGDNPDNSLVPFFFNDDIWEKINELECDTANSIARIQKGVSWQILRNPVSHFLELEGVPSDQTLEYVVYNGLGQLCISGELASRLDCSSLEAGLYWIGLNNGRYKTGLRFVKE